MSPIDPIPLIVPTAEAVMASPGFTLLTPGCAWDRPPAVLVEDLFDRRLGAWLAREAPLRRPGLGVNRLRDQFVFGFHHLHAVIGRDRIFHCQDINRYRARLDYHIANAPPESYRIPVIHRAGDGYVAEYGRVSGPEVTRLEGTVMFGSPIEPANWGMWLLHGLLTASAFVQGGQVGRYLCYAEADWMRRLLAIVGVKPDRLVEQAPWATYDVEDLVLHQYTDTWLVPDAAVLGAVSHLVDRFAINNDGLPERIFVARRSVTREAGGNYRALVNEEAMIAAAEALGFTIVEPERLPFERQVAMFHAARVVVGLGGAGMFNTVFCAPGTRVLSIEGTAAFASNHAMLFAALGHEYGFLFGRENEAAGAHPHNPWEVDVGRATAAIVRFMRG